VRVKEEIPFVACNKPRLKRSVTPHPIKIMENSTTKTREALLHDVDKLKTTAFKVADDVRNHANAHVNQVKARATDTFETVHDTLTTHPLALVGVGFFFGMLFGLRLRR